MVLSISIYVQICSMKSIEICCKTLISKQRICSLSNFALAFFSALLAGVQAACCPSNTLAGCRHFAPSGVNNQISRPPQKVKRVMKVASTACKCQRT